MLISIVIPTYERPEFLRRLLHSISQQTFRDFEVLIIDDHSTQVDKYDEVLSFYSKLLPRIKYFRNSLNQGACISRNRGILEAKGEWVALVDDDDEWLPTKLQKQIKLIGEGSGSGPLGLIYTWAYAVKNNQKVWENRSEIEGNAIRDILKNCFIPSSSVLLKKEALIAAGMFDTSFPSCQDWDMWTRVFAKGYECGVVKSFEIICHKHELRSIGSGPKASFGYELYSQKHKNLFRKHLFFSFFVKQIKTLVKNIITSKSKKQYQ